MKIAAGHESKNQAAMSKAGDVVVVIPISTGHVDNDSFLASLAHRQTSSWLGELVMTICSS